MITPANPAAAGYTTILIYCTGLGPVNNRPATGAAASVDTLSATTTNPTVTIGNMPAQVLWSGLAPGSVGEYQVNVFVPANTPTGDAQPLVLSIGGAQSNAVLIPVQPPTADQRADQLVTQMTEDEKIQLVYGAGGPVTNQIALPRGGAGWVPVFQPWEFRISTSPMAAWAWATASARPPRCLLPLPAPPVGT